MNIAQLKYGKKLDFEADYLIEVRNSLISFHSAIKTL